MNLLERIRTDATMESKLQGVEAENTSLRVDLEEATKTVTDHAAEIANLKESLAEAEKVQAELDELKSEIEASAKRHEEALASLAEDHAAELEAEKAKTTPEAIQALVTAEIIKSGADPVEFVENADPREAKSGTPHLDKFESLSGAAASAYFKKHSKDIRAEMRNH